MDPSLWREIWEHHSGKIIGIIGGFLIGMLVITFGFFRTLFVLLCIIAGYIIGKKIDGKEDIMDILDKLLPPGYHR
jgi:uncharacterized membrane protein